MNSLKFSEVECFEILNELADSQWYVEIKGTSWYDGAFWHIRIYDPFHSIIVDTKVVNSETLLEAINLALNALLSDKNGSSFLYGFRKSQQLKDQ